MQLTAEMERYISSSQAELLQLIRDLCAIPAPSHHEEARAEYCRQWFVQNGGSGAYIDAALNVVCPWNLRQDGSIAVVMAHTDTVFPDMQPMELREQDGMMYCPGVTDDTANLAVLMICARYIMQHRLPTRCGLLFVANSCEEGLGNLKGSRQVFADFGDRIREFITFDGSKLHEVVAEAVGSHRYRVAVQAAGGHSFSSFGKPNAIAQLANLISDLYAVKPPAEGSSKTTYNVGLISGGTSVNTIAPQAEMLWEYRSDSRSCLARMEAIFNGIVESHRAKGADIQVERIGDRPCTGNVEPAAQAALLARAGKAIKLATGEDMQLRSGSTDANVALAAGVPAICVGVCRGGRCHSREEWLDISSLEAGCRLAMALLEDYLG